MGDLRIVPLGELWADPLVPPKTTLFFHQAQCLRLWGVRTLGFWKRNFKMTCQIASLSNGLTRDRDLNHYLIPEHASAAMVMETTYSWKTGLHSSNLNCRWSSGFCVDEAKSSEDLPTDDTCYLFS